MSRWAFQLFSSESFEEEQEEEEEEDDDDEGIDTELEGIDSDHWHAPPVVEAPQPSWLVRVPNFFSSQQQQQQPEEEEEEEEDDCAQAASIIIIVLRMMMLPQLLLMTDRFRLRIIRQFSVLRR
jgi:hypothetical protein